MLRKCGKALSNKKGQIGEIVVVVVLIILAVLGIVKYVMPMFNNTGAMAGTAGNQMDSLSQSAANAQYGAIGDEVPAQTIINVWNSTRGLSSDDGITITVYDTDASTQICERDAGTNDDYGTYKAGTSDADALIDEMATYRIKTLDTYANGKPSAIEYVKVIK